MKLLKLTSTRLKVIIRTIGVGTLSNLAVGKKNVKFPEKLI